MEEVKLTKEQEILFEVYDKGVQNEDCDLDAYVEKMKQALRSSELESLRTENERLRGLKDWIMSAQVAAEQGECLMPNITDVLNEIERLTSTQKRK